MTNSSEAITALKILFPKDLLNHGNIMLKIYKPYQKAVTYTELGHLEQMLKENEFNQNSLGFGVAVRRKNFVVPPNGSHGAKEDCTAVQVLKADFDGIEPQSGPKLPLTDAEKEKVRIAILAGPVKPALIVDSGGGLHTYYKLKSPLILSSREVITRLEKLNAGIFDYFESLNLPCEIDRSVKDVSRLMRLPGSMNYRYGAPRMVRILEVIS